MDFDFCRTIRLNDETEHKNLYKWCLQEVGEDGQQVGPDWIPWPWGVYFAVTELRYWAISSQGIESFFGAKKVDRQAAIFKDGLRATLCSETPLSMFGTDRTIESMTLRIERLDYDSDADNSHAGLCRIWGSARYTSEVDFQDWTTPDCIEVILRLPGAHFDPLAAAVRAREIDKAELLLKNAQGFYASWTPSVTTGQVKVLTAGAEQKFTSPLNCQIDPPRLNEVGEWRLTTGRVCHLKNAPAPDAFGDKEILDSVPETEPDRQANQSELLATLARNVRDLNSLKRPLWITVGLLAGVAWNYIF